MTCPCQRALLRNLFWLLLFGCHYRHHTTSASFFSDASFLYPPPSLFHLKKTHYTKSAVGSSSCMLFVASPSSSSLSSKKDDVPIKIDSDSSSLSLPPLFGLRVAIVGGGPSGLLLAHRLLQSGATVNLYEKRPRPTTSSTPPPQEEGEEVKMKIGYNNKNNNTIESSSASASPSSPRAYALGIGIRGRTAIQSVDQHLWRAVKAVGYSSERFILHVGPLAIRLRDESDSTTTTHNNNNNNSDEENVAVEPSLLLFQSDLCRVLADELEQQWAGDRDDDDDGNNMSTGRLSIMWNCAVQSIDLKSKSLVVAEQTSNDDKKYSFDLLVGSDGVNSVVRPAINETYFPAFETRQELIPGLLKVVQLDAMPPLLDPTAVQLVFPKSGGVTAFVEPTANGTCCVLFAGRNGTDLLLSKKHNKPAS